MRGSATFLPDEFSDYTRYVKPDPKPLRFSKTKNLERCSLCDKRRRRFVKVTTPASGCFYGFCSTCVRSMHRRLA